MGGINNSITMGEREGGLERMQPEVGKEGKQVTLKPLNAIT
jgi:hypothetical protein